MKIPRSLLKKSFLDIDETILEVENMIMQNIEEMYSKINDDGYISSIQTLEFKLLDAYELIKYLHALQQIQNKFLK